jgi:hypothetical protein
MSNNYKKLLTSNQVAGEIKKDQFFTDENVNGYMTKSELLTYSRGLTDLQRDQFNLFFEYTVELFSITSLPVESEDKETGESLLWVTFKLPGTPQNFRMIYHPGLLRYIKDCQRRKINPAFTFDQLIEEAIKAEEQGH